MNVERKEERKTKEPPRVRTVSVMSSPVTQLPSPMTRPDKRPQAKVPTHAPKPSTTPVIPVHADPLLATHAPSPLICAFTALAHDLSPVHKSLPNNVPANALHAPTPVHVWSPLIVAFTTLAHELSPAHE
jgi:hypothetical protein